MTIENQIKKSKSDIFRRCYIKRRLKNTGLFESEWLEITDDVKRWGTIGTQVDVVFQSRYKFLTNKMTVENSSGRYNSETSPVSLWYGYASQQRSLLKIEAGFVDYTQTGGIWSSVEYPTAGAQPLFVGLVNGEMPVTNSEDVNLNIRPLNQVFIDFPAQNLVGFTSTGLTASQFCEILRDMTDGAGSYIFRPFFNDTASNWLITTTTTIYPGLNTSTAKDIRGKNAWDVLQKISEAESYTPYINSQGQFVFGPNSIASSTSFQFYGPNEYNGTYGITIKSIKSFGVELSNFYSRVEVKFLESDTITSYATTQTAMVVAGDNDSWNLGFRTLQIENNLIATTAAANTICQRLFDEFSALKRKIVFDTSFIPHLQPNQRIDITYQSGSYTPESIWDENDWDTELYWDKEDSSSIELRNVEFKALGMKINLDALATEFTAREN